MTNGGRETVIEDLVPADFVDPVVEAYKRDVDRTMLRENLRLSVQSRIQKAESFHRSIDGWRGAGMPAPPRGGEGAT